MRLLIYETHQLIISDSSLRGQVLDDRNQTLAPAQDGDLGLGPASCQLFIMLPLGSTENSIGRSGETAFPGLGEALFHPF